MSGEVVEIRTRRRRRVETLRDRVSDALRVLVMCPFSEIEIVAVGEEVVAQFPQWTDSERSFIRNKAAELLARRGFHVQLRDVLSVVVREGGDHATP